MPFLPGDFHTNVPLTQAALKRFQKDRRFVARAAAPRMPVGKLSGTYYKWDMDAFNRDEFQVRGPNSPTPVADFGRSLAMYEVKARGLGYNVNEWAKLSADVQVEPSKVIPVVLAYKAKINLERLFAAFAFNSASWYRTVTGGASDAANRGGTTGVRKYFNDSSTDPIKAIREEINDQGLLTGFDPTGIIFGVDLFEAIAMHPLVRATLTNGSSAVLRTEPANEAEIARLCGVPWVRVGRAIYNMALEGETPTNRRIIPTDGMLLYYRADEEVADSVADDAGVLNTEMPCGMARVQWEAAVGNTEGFRLRSFPDPDAGPGGSEKTVADSAHDFASINSAMGTLFTGMLSA